MVRHIQNAFREGELVRSATCANFAVATTKDVLVVQSEGKRSVRRKLKHYDLDAIISVGYRVHSKRAVRFRQWPHAPCARRPLKAGVGVLERDIEGR